MFFRRGSGSLALYNHVGLGVALQQKYPPWRGTSQQQARVRETLFRAIKLLVRAIRPAATAGVPPRTTGDVLEDAFAGPALAVDQAGRDSAGTRFGRLGVSIVSERDLRAGRRICRYSGLSSNPFIARRPHQRTGVGLPSCIKAFYCSASSG